MYHTLKQAGILGHLDHPVHAPYPQASTSEPSTMSKPWGGGGLGPPMAAKYYVKGFISWDVFSNHHRFTHFFLLRPSLWIWCIRQNGKLELSHFRAPKGCHLIKTIRSKQGNMELKYEMVRKKINSAKPSYYKRDR